MKTLISRTLPLLAVATLSATPAAWALQTPAQHSAIDQPVSAKAASLRGELVRVDIDAKTIVVKAADAMEHTFRYTDQTEVSGAQGNVAGLATKAGSPVTVFYTGEKDTRTATKIVVDPR